MKDGTSNPEVIQKIIRVLGMSLLIGIVIYLLLTNHTEGISVVVKDDHLSLSHSSGGPFEVNYKDILSVTETRDLALGQYVSGIATKAYKFGVWENNEFGKYHLCIYANIERYIVVKTSTEVFVLNFESEDATDSFYMAFLELLQTRPVQATP